MSKAHGLIMVDSLEVPKGLPNDVVYRKVTEFTFDLVDKKITMRDQKETKEYNIIKSYMNIRGSYYNSHVFEIDGGRLMVLSFVKTKTSIRVAVSLVLSTHGSYLRRWLVDMYHVPADGFIIEKQNLKYTTN